ncbi:MAG: XdhC family protein [Erythrobacter sp.]|uniref:XdhC family protein n=1 Tax=Erythrobacter sp. TaxID=1042 RepID=UPI003296EBAE
MDLAQTLQFLDSAQKSGLRTVLVTVCGVEGSSMRGPGTIMGVAEDGQFAGSLSGGCIENAVVSEALDVLAKGQARTVRFGAGSSYLDIKLPCGGGLDVSFHVIEDAGFAGACLASIVARAPFSIATGIGGAAHVAEWRKASFDAVSGEAVFGHYPAPHMQIIGHGAGVMALADLASAYGCTLRVLTPDKQLVEQCAVKRITVNRGAGNKIAVHHLKQTNQTELLQSDAWTATVFLFHDHDWEIDLMAAALQMPHFYLGAMGGRRAHEFRCEALLALGVTQSQLDRIHAPIGLFHSSRDPQTLALSALAEVVRTYEETVWDARV